MEPSAQVRVSGTGIFVAKAISMADTAGAPVTNGVSDNAKPESAPAEEKDWADDDGTNGVDELGAALGGLDDKETNVKVVQADPTTPYQSASSFEEIGLSEALLKGVYAMKFNKPSKIQASSLPMILSSDGEYKNLIAQGHNGSGKTACFVLSMLSRVDDKIPKTQALCVVPTRELARQIQDIVKQLGKFTETTSRLAVSFTDAERQELRRNRGATRGAINEHIVIGTPGKVLDLMKKRELDPSSTRILVLDEADQMVSQQGMGDQTVRIKKQLPKTVQVLLFSATYADEVKKLAEIVAPNSNQIAIERTTLALDKLQQYYIKCESSQARFEIVMEIYDFLQLGQTILFVRTRRDAQALTKSLRENSQTVSVLTGGEMTPDERDRVIDEFRNGTTRVLVTTDVLSRGVDVPAVTAVINYDLPVDVHRHGIDAETYLHRIGRAGRFGRKGLAINLVYDDRGMAMVEELIKYYKKEIVPIDDVEALQERIKSL